MGASPPLPGPRLIVLCTHCEYFVTPGSPRQARSLGLALLLLPPGACERWHVTYRIHRSVTPQTIVFALSGEVDTEHADRLDELLASEANNRVILDLGDVTLVHR